MAETDWKKVAQYNKMFQEWKRELFPRQEYKYRNECCYAFAHLLAQKAQEEGLLPLKAWCLQSEKREFPADSPINIKTSAEDYTVSLVRPTGNPMEAKESGWHNYHVAMCLQSGSETYVFDPIIFDGVTTLKQWQSVLNAKDYNVEVTGCSLDGKNKNIINGGSGYWRASNPPNLDNHARQKIAAVDCEQAPEHLLRSKLLIDLQRNSRQTGQVIQNRQGRFA